MQLLIGQGYLEVSECIISARSCYCYKLSAKYDCFTL